MAVPLTVKQYLIKQELVKELEGSRGDQLMAKVFKELGVEAPPETNDDGEPNVEYASWQDALGRVHRRLIS